MTTLHAHFILRNQQAFQRLLDVSRPSNTQATSGAALSSSGGRSWTKSNPLSGGPSGGSADVNARDWLGRTVLHLAVSALDPSALEFVKLLLSHPKTDVNMRDKESRWTPLHRAMYVGNIPACVLLLQRPDIDVSLKDFEGYTAFDVYNSTVEGTKPNTHEVTDLYTWGTNRNAALGVGDGDDRTFPELVAIPPQEDCSDASKVSLRDRFEPIRAKKVAMAKLHTALITSEPHANLRICGFGSGGRLGAGIAQYTQYAFSVPKDLASEAQVTSVALGQDHTLALTSAGSVLSWGLNRFSQLGYALDGGQTLQAAPRRIVGPLKKEVALGVAACRTASACWTESELFTWGTNSGQLGYDRVGTPAQVLPRRVAHISLPVLDVALSDVAMAVLLSSRDVHCFHNGRSFKINFPTQSFPSEIQVYRPPMAHNNASIAKVVNCDNNFAALSSNGEVFTFTLNVPPSVASVDSSATPSKVATKTPVKPQRVWSLRKQFSAVKDVALGPDGTILICTEAGHAYLRSRTNKSSKFTRVPLLHRVVSVAGSSAGAFAALKAEYAPVPIRVEGNSIAEDLKMIQPFFLSSVGEEWQNDADSLISNIPTPPPLSTFDGVDVEAEDDYDGVSIRKDVKTIARLVDLLGRDAARRKAEGKGLFEGINLLHGADLFLKVDSGFEFPIHRVIFAARSQVLKNVMLGQASKDSTGKLRCQMNESKPKALHPTLLLSGVHPLSALMLAVYLYSDELPAVWDRRVAFTVSEKLAGCVPNTNASNVRTDLQGLALLLHLPPLAYVLDAPVKRLPNPRLASDMKTLLDSVSKETVQDLGSLLVHPLAPDTMLQLNDAQVRCHSTILRARSPFFASLFGDPDWTAKRKQTDRVLVVKLGHMRLQATEFAMQFIYSDGNEDIFDILDFAQTTDEVLEFLFEVMDTAGELLLDRLLLICSSVILRFLNIYNACFILSEASFFNASQLNASVQGYLARNLETLLESHMVDDLPTHLIRQFAEFVRNQQALKLPVTRSGKIIERALEKWKDWLELQDFPQPVIPGYKASSSQIHQSPKLSPVAVGTTGKKNRWPSVIQMSASYSPPQGRRLPLTPPSAPIDEEAEAGTDDVFVMDDLREEIPPLILPASRASLSGATPKAGPPPPIGRYSPWRARISQVPASKLDLRAIMADAESQRAASIPTPMVHQTHSRVVGFDVSTSGSPVRASLKTMPAPISTPPKVGPGSPRRAPKPDAGLSHAVSPVIGDPALARRSSERLQESPGPSGLTRDLRENRTTSNRAPTSVVPTSATRPTQASPGKGKAAASLGPTFTPTRQPPPASATPMARQVSEGTTKAWSMIPSAFAPEPTQSDGAGSSNAAVSFLSIQQQQRDQNAGPTRIKKSLLEIQAEEEAQAKEEQALREEIEFMRWWSAEEERIRRETQAQPGPPISGPGAGGNQRGRKKGKNGGAREVGQSGKKPTQQKAPALDGQGDKEHVGNADGKKNDRRMRRKPAKVKGSNTDT